MSIIDIHAHILTYEMARAVASTGTSLPPAIVEEDEGVFLERGDKIRFGVVPRSIFELDVRLQEMDRQGVEVQAIAVAPMIMGYEDPAAIGVRIARAINDSLLEAASVAPSRFEVVGTLPMQAPEAAADEVRWLATHASVSAVQIGTQVDGSNLDHPSFEPVWAALADARLPVILHPSPPSRPPGLEKYFSGAYYLGNLIGNPTDSTVAAASLIFGGVLDRHPSLRLALVHGGGFVPYQIGRWDHGWRCRPEARTAIDRPPSHYLDRFFFDTLTHDPLSLDFLARRVGVSRMALGSDFPFDMAEADPVAKVRALQLSDEDEAAVLSRTPRSFLRRSEGAQEGG